MKPHTLNLTAKTAQELLTTLKHIDITVPAVTEGRTTQHRERYLMARFLATSIDSKRLEYPLSVEHCDKPDFVLQFATKRLGIECVEAVPQEWYEIQSLREKHFPEAFNFGQMFKPKEKVFTHEEKLEIANGSLSGPPWVGKMAVRQWAEAMEHFIQIKTEKLRSDYYSEFPHMWLLIQDEWRVPIYDEDEIRESTTLCLAKIESLLNPPCFSSIFICCREWLIILERNKFSIELINDIWREQS